MLTVLPRSLTSRTVPNRETCSPATFRSNSSRSAKRPSKRARLERYASKDANSLRAACSREEAVPAEGPEGVARCGNALGLLGKNRYKNPKMEQTEPQNATLLHSFNCRYRCVSFTRLSSGYRAPNGLIMRKTVQSSVHAWFFLHGSPAWFDESRPANHDQGLSRSEKPQGATGAGTFFTQLSVYSRLTI